MDSDMVWDYYDDGIDYNKKYWTTRDGKTIEIELMETSHIKNTINLLKRNLEKINEPEYKNYIEFKIDELKRELKKRDVYKRHTLE